MSDRLLSEASGHTDYSGFGTHAAHGLLDPAYGHQDAYGVGGGYGAGDGYGAGYQDAQQWAAVPQESFPQESFPQEPFPQDGYQQFPPFQQFPQESFHQEQQQPYPPEQWYGETGYESGTWYAGGPAAEDFHETPAPRGGPAADTGTAHEPDPGLGADPDLDGLDDVAADPGQEWAPDDPAPESGPPSAARPQRRGGRRRSARPRRSAFLSVAAPSLAVLGVTAVATAATVSESDTPQGGEPAPVAAPDPGEVQQVAANQQFDSQLAGLTEAVDDYSDRASRTQGRLDLQAQQEAEAEAAAAEAARIEAERQKFFVPVEQAGLSAYFGQSGINWMSTHTGIDFPVSYGTPVVAATDGSISTQWHPSYGNMVILTAPDGTETWYAHLDSTVFTSGHVQAGTVIAYSGNSGTSTGPHLHFEVRPGGGSPIDPLTWLRGQGLEPT
ncbi:M23 family metallopeptidase [Streptomyces johnsoniae]|uniref:M23 family metallopeptidase n=1 Tax=Streptomyces johnsoniae TaxID=3075532 RepID=A0ABU2S6C1_9ACTN|nr:M23 family metallopeptidase [Streptomyces sp. DSM 41886]MDT0443660.1 M23 family metallopeptidase [Streptomyces sp. DSM 41886]